MTHAEREWLDGRPEGTRPDEGAGPLAEHGHEDGPLVEHVRTDGPLVEPAHDGGSPVEEAQEKDRLAEPAPAAAGGVEAGAGTSQAPHAPPAGSAENERFAARWREIQAGFVDEPRRAIQDADALVVDMMDRLARMLASEREQIESLGETGTVSTEDLRQGLRRYRALFERLLAV
jgi:hypothetical protein